MVAAASSPGHQTVLIGLFPLVGLGQVDGAGGVLVDRGGRQQLVGGYPLVVVPDLQRLGADLQVNVGADVDVGHRVVILRPGDMAITADPAAPHPGGHLERHRRQRAQPGCLLRLEDRLA